MDLINIGADLATNNAQPFAVEEIVNEYSDETPAEVSNGEGKDDDNYDNDESTSLITPPTRNDIHEAIKTLFKLCLFTDDVEFDLSPLKLELRTEFKLCDSFPSISISNSI